MLTAIKGAIERSRALLAQEASLQSLHECYKGLTPRVRHVMALIVRGQLNKQVASELDIAEITVKVHRGAGDAQNGGAFVRGARRYGCTFGAPPGQR